MELKLLQIGPPKCGNYWLYNLIQKIYHNKGIGYKSFISNQPVYGEAKNWELSHSLQAGIDMIDIERGKHQWMWHVTDYLLLKDEISIYFISYEWLLKCFRFLNTNSSIRNIHQL